MTAQSPMQYAALLFVVAGILVWVAQVGWMVLMLIWMLATQNVQPVPPHTLVVFSVGVILVGIGMMLFGLAEVMS